MMPTLTDASPLAQLARMDGTSELLLHSFLKAVFSMSPEDRKFYLWEMQHREKCEAAEKADTLSAEDRAFLDDCTVLYDAARPNNDRADAYDRLKDRWLDATTGRKGLRIIRGGRQGSEGSKAR